MGPTTATTPSRSINSCVAATSGGRPGLVVGIDHLDGPAEDPARRVDVLDRKIKPELGLLAIELDATGKRQHRADADRLGGTGAG
jgi:hypothetical protein